MKTASELIEQQLTSLPTPAGRTTTGLHTSKNRQHKPTALADSHTPVTHKRCNEPTETTRADAADRDNQQSERALEQAINSLFLFLEAAYPYKYRKAFPTHEAEIRAKRVWKSALQEYAPRRIVRAGQKALRTSRFFPDLGDICKHCQLNYRDLNLKDPVQAYHEACCAPSQRRDYPWSHIAVYLAAQATGWFMLRGEAQSVVFPIFERNYTILCNRVLDGENLAETVLKGLAHDSANDAIQQAEVAAEQAQRQWMAQQGIGPDDGQAALERLRTTLKYS